jgi:starch phosphorylase
MFKLRTYTVVPALPEPLARLRDLAYNVWWCWNGDAMELFRRLDPDLWNDLGNNPIQVLAHLAQRRLDQLAADRAYLSHLQRVVQSYDAYMTRETWFTRSHPDLRDTRIAYFSMEFGLHESLPFYSGGLGVLAGDHLKSASDLGLPLVGIGLAYRQGYFQQRVSSDGWQVEENPSFDYFQLPMSLVKTDSGDTLVLSLPIGDHDVKYILWRIQVGRVPLYLMDTDLPENHPKDRDLTHRLYGGDEDTRIRQEILLGIGGLRALRALKLQPDVCHMNEGHAAFMTVERIIQQREQQGLDFGEAREAVAPSHVFTTHTPIPAGIDRFEQSFLVKYLTPYLHGMGLSLSEFTALGKKNASDPDELFSMAIFALRLCGMANGVSALHGHVSREMWHDVWPGAPRDEVPITSITNGIHTSTWIAPAMADLLYRYLGPLQVETPVDHDFWRRVDEIPDLELWRTHEQRRVALVAYARTRLREQLRRRGAPPTEIKAADQLLDPDALTIGFARRFAPYKRGALLFTNPERLAKILGDPDRPVQIIFAGKAHPRDDNGKAVLKEVIANSRLPQFHRRIIFLENYEFSMARMLVQGCDIWLNNPIKPREASGTSGMKVSVNGGINLSVLDGWWPEAYDGENGWTIDEGRIYDDPAYRDHVESESIYDLLEKEIVPLFYNREADGIPRGWVEKMKASMRTICPLFNTNRMIQEYAQQLYVPAAHRWRHLTSEAYTHAKGLSTWKHKLAGNWSSVRIDHVEANDAGELPVGSKVQVRARIHLGSVKPDDVAVELYHGRIDPSGQLMEGSAETMSCREHVENGSFWFDGQIPCTRSGQLGYAIRVVPKHPDLVHRYDTGLICWG